MTRSGKTTRNHKTKEEEDKYDDSEEDEESIAKALRGLKKSIDFMSRQFDVLTKENKEMKKQMKKLEKDNSELKKKIEAIELISDNKEKQNISTNILITGIDTKENNENANDIFEKVLKGMNLKTGKESIKKSYIKNNKTGTKSQIIVELRNENDKQEILQARKTIGSIRTKECGLKGQNREIYINEQLTERNSTIFYQARQLKKDKIYKYVWTRDGNVYVRKTETSTKQKIRSLNDLDEMDTEST